MANDILISVCKISAGIASAIIILRVVNLKSWRFFTEYNRLQGKTFIITGANSGIGKELARQIVTSGGNVVMLCRDTQKGKIAMKEILQKPTPHMGTVTLRRMDLNSFASVEKSAKEIIESIPRIDCLINNAGVMMAPFSITEDGFESHVQSNHLGHALLTHLLLPKIASFGTHQNPTRVVFVSSTLYKRGKIIEDHFKSGAVTPETFDQKLAYSNSKLASLLFACELSNEVKRRGLPVIINSASPGMVYTNLGMHFNMSWYQKLFSLPFFAIFVRVPVEGARIILYAAASEKSLHSNGAFIQNYEEKPIDSKFNSEMCKKVYELTMDAINKSTCKLELTDPYNLAIHHKNQGNKLFKQGKYDEALDCYSKAIECCPKDKTSDLSIFYQNRAAVYETNKNYEAVVEECSKAIKSNRKYIKALQRRAKAYESLGYISDALRDITAVDILEGFQNKNNLLMTDRLLKQLSKTKSKQYFSNRPFSMPSKHFIKNYFSSYCRDPLVKNTEDLDGDKLYSILKELKSEKLLEEKPGNASAKCSLLEGTIDILKGNIGEGERKLDLILGFVDVDIDVKVNALIKLGTIKVQEVDGNSEGLNSALQCFKQAIELDSNNQDIYIHRAQIYLLAEKIDEALEDLEKCCSLAPDFPSAIAQRLYVTYRIAFRSEDYERIKELLKGFEDALEQFPTSTEVYSLYAQMLTEQGEYAKADKLFLKAIECDPKDANLIVHRGILAMQTNFDFEKARDLLEQALKIDNKCTFAHEMLGTLEVQRGNLTKGIECFDKALENSSTEMDCAHLFSLREAAVAQISAVESLGISLTPR